MTHELFCYKSCSFPCCRYSVLLWVELKENYVALSALGYERRQGFLCKYYLSLRGWRFSEKRQLGLDNSYPQKLPLQQNFSLSPE